MTELTTLSEETGCGACVGQGEGFDESDVVVDVRSTVFVAVDGWSVTYSVVVDSGSTIVTVTWDHFQEMQ